MRILIVGLPKSGTTILTYRVAEALDQVHVDFEPQGGPGSEATGPGNVVTKKLIGSQTDGFSEFQHYDRKIWISRDPRDFLVSQSLYRWHRETPPDAEDRRRFHHNLELLRKKEHDPVSVAFRDLEPADYFETLDAVAGLHDTHVDDGWFVYRYEDMVDGRYEALNAYLGFEVAAEAEVASGLERVVRRKGYGDWRDWFTPADVAHYRAGGLDRYMTTFDYPLDDWRLNEPQYIDPAHGSQYVDSLFTDHRPTPEAAAASPSDVRPQEPSAPVSSEPRSPDPGPRWRQRIDRFLGSDRRTPQTSARRSR